MLTLCVCVCNVNYEQVIGTRMSYSEYSVFLCWRTYGNCIASTRTHCRHERKRLQNFTTQPTYGNTSSCLQSYTSGSPHTSLYTLDGRAHNPGTVELEPIHYSAEEVGRLHNIHILPAILSEWVPTGEVRSPD